MRACPILSLIMLQHLQEAKGVKTVEVARTKELLQDIERAAAENFVYFRGRATVFAKPGTNWFSKAVRGCCFSCCCVSLPETHKQESSRACRCTMQTSAAAVS